MLERKRHRKKYKVICKYCGKEGLVTSKKCIFCSQKCFFDNKKQEKNKSICKTCNNEFYWRSNSRPQTFCSKACMRTCKHGKCERCGEEFKWNTSSRPQKYCSDRCRLEAVTKTEEYKKEKGRMDWLISRYGIDIEEFNYMLITQGGVCAICGTDKPRNNKSDRNFCVDHNHETGAVRGLLCNTCNTAIGMIGEDVNILRKAISYLEYYDK